MAVENDISWKILGLAYLGLAMVAAGAAMAFDGGHWIIGPILFVMGIAFFVGFMAAVYLHAKRHGPMVMDFKRFGETFRWW
jgi:hypothetical protein